MKGGDSPAPVALSRVIIRLPLFYPPDSTHPLQGYIPHRNNHPGLPLSDQLIKVGTAVINGGSGFRDFMGIIHPPQTWGLTLDRVNDCESMSVDSCSLEHPV